MDYNFAGFSGRFLEHYQLKALEQGEINILKESLKKMLNSFVEVVRFLEMEGVDNPRGGESIDRMLKRIKFREIVPE